MPCRASSSLCALLLWASACSSDYGAAPPPPSAPPPPLPVAPAAVPVPPPAQPAAGEAARPEPRKARDAVAPTRTAKQERSSRSSKASAPVAPAPTKAPVASTPSKTPAPAPVKPTGKVTVPSTAHVRIDVPSALQADLDHDPRMQPWVNQVISVIDRCYTQSAGGGGLAGTIEVVVTMHENERPDADIKQLPPQLSPIVACATGGLMRTKMPLFTGAEGARRSVRIVFK